jgi:hypothetical protein
VESAEGLDDASLLTKSVVAWTGWGRAAWPLRDVSAVADQLGDDLAAKLIPLVHRLEAEFNASEAWRLGDLGQVGDVASEEFRTRHPELGEEAVKALAWCYTYDWK